MKVIIDTNVLLDLMMDRPEFERDAEHAFTICLSELAEGYVSAKSFCDLHYFISKYLHDSKLAKNVIETWVNLINIVDITDSDCRNALGSDMTDYEDAVIAAAANRTGCDYIVTRNIKDFRNSPVPAITPSDFVKLAMR